MRQRREATRGAKAERGSRGRIGLVVAIVSLLVPWHRPGCTSELATQKITSVTPNHGCPGDTVTIVGSALSSSEQLTWTDPTGEFVTFVTRPYTHLAARKPRRPCRCSCRSRMRLERATAPEPSGSR